jgi:hypothetical protein
MIHKNFVPKAGFATLMSKEPNPAFPILKSPG